VPWWGVASATAAPVLLVGGWTVAAALQPATYDWRQDTISALAALDAADRWVKTSALAGTGACHIVTALALRPAAAPGRVVLALGGVATALVAAAPLPSGDGGSVPHTVAATAAFLALSVWPALGWRAAVESGDPVPAGLRPVPAITASLVLLGLLLWFAVELVGDGDRVGLAERVAAAAQSCWPLAVVGSWVLAVRRSQRLGAVR
jgi:hypothetical membrane protein